MNKALWITWLCLALPTAAFATPRATSEHATSQGSASPTRLAQNSSRARTRRTPRRPSRVVPRWVRRARAERNQIRAVVMDSDGTTFDSWASFEHATVRALARVGENVPVEVIRERLGRVPYAANYLQLVPEAKRADFERVLDEEYDAQPTDNDGVVFYPGVREVAEQYLGRVPFGIATNNSSERTNAVVEHLRARPIFGARVFAARGAGAYPRKPDPAMILAFARAVGVRPDQVLMIGDGKKDILAAQAAGARSAFVTYGYGTRAELGDVVPNHVIDRAEQLRALLDGDLTVGKVTAPHTREGRRMAREKARREREAGRGKHTPGAFTPIG